VFGDTQIRPIKGQLVILLPQPEVDYAYLYLDPNNLLYMVPRSDGIVLGGTEEDGESSLAPDPKQITRILEGHRAIQGL
jgi:glycine/D-amino acid oxidase-like deaminating enzyme